MNANPPGASPQEQGAGTGRQEAVGAVKERERKKGKREEFETIQLNMLPMMALFTIILCYLLKNYSTDPVQITPSPGMELAQSTTKHAPQEEAVQVAISERVIVVDDRKVADVRNGRVAVEYKKDRNPASMVILPLFEALKKKADNHKLLAKYDRKRKVQFKGLLTVIADKRVPFRLLTEVLYTAGQAEYGSYKFAVLKQEQ